MSVKAVLFDLDGTLLDSIECILASFRHVLDKHAPAKRYSRTELIMMIGEPVPAQMLAFSDGNQAIVGQMVDDYRAHNQASLPDVPLYPAVKETLAELKRRGFVVGLVTSKGSKSLAVSFERHGLAPYFDLVMTADDTSRHKPDPMPLVVASERLGLAPASVVYVGDSVHDLRCAQGAGAVDVAALWGPFERATLAALRPRHMIETLPELLGLPMLAYRG